MKGAGPAGHEAMMNERNPLPFATLMLALLCSVSAAQQAPVEVRDDFTKQFEHFHVRGSFTLYDLRNNKWILCNQEQLKKPFIPASTFKICNSLIGLETGVIKDEDFLIKWDGVVRSRPEWNKDHDLKTAFKNSTVWYYQELARRVGGERMKRWLDLAGYGNADTSGGIDLFWLSGGLRITPEQQILFLKRLYLGDLPFSKRTMDIVRRIMVAKDTVTYTLRAKTGWGYQDNLDIGWYVGSLETRSSVYFFATCIQRPDSDESSFLRARIEITLGILRELKFL
jgi:beta-lactamase class D